MNNDRLREIIRRTITDLLDAPLVRVGVSNRHIHLSRSDMDMLFGAGYELKPVKELLPGQYASNDTVTVKGPKGKLERVRVLGPVRSATQLEISLTDSFTIGVAVPINESGNLDNAGTVTIENEATGANISRTCAIAALRHIHLTRQFAERFGFSDKQIVSVEFTGVRNIIFGGVLLRVSKDYLDEMHLDIDEANAGNIKNNDIGRILV